MGLFNRKNKVLSDAAREAHKARKANKEAKEQRDTAREQMGMFGDMVKAFGELSQVFANQRQSVMNEVVALQKLQEGTAAEAADAALEIAEEKHQQEIATIHAQVQAQAGGQGRMVLNPQDMDPKDFAAMRFIDIISQYADAPRVESGRPVELERANHLLAKAGIDLSKIDVSKVRPDHIKKMKALLAEVSK